MNEGDGLAVAGVMIKESDSAQDNVLPELFDIVPKLKSMLYLVSLRFLIFSSCSTSSPCNIP